MFELVELYFTSDMCNVECIVHIENNGFVAVQSAELEKWLPLMHVTTTVAFVKMVNGLYFCSAFLPYLTKRFAVHLSFRH